MEISIRQALRRKNKVFGAAYISIPPESELDDPETIYVTYTYKRDGGEIIFDELSIHDASIKAHEMINWRIEQRLKAGLMNLTEFLLSLNSKGL